MTEVGDGLRALLVQARRDPERWGKRHGLSQSALATRAGVSAIWLRQIETGQAQSASADTLGRICYELEIDAIIVKGIGYYDVAAAIDACVMLKEKAIPDHLIDNPPRRSAEDHVRNTPGTTPRQRTLLLKALTDILKQPA